MNGYVSDVPSTIGSATFTEINSRNAESVRRREYSVLRRAVSPATLSIKASDITGVTEALQPKQQPSNPLPLWSTTAEEQAIVPPHNSIDWQSSNMLRILHQRASSPESFRAADDVGTESYWPSGLARP